MPPPRMFNQCSRGFKNGNSPIASSYWKPKRKFQLEGHFSLFAFRGMQTQAMVACFYCVKQTEILPGEVSLQAGGEA